MRQGGGKRVEKWRAIRGYEMLYEISNLGNVRTVATGSVKQQSGGPGTSCRYKYVTLYRENIGRKIMVHRLVATTFIPNPRGYPYVLHRQNDRTNNAALNLKWGTQFHNHLDAVREGTYKPFRPMRGTDNPLAKLNPQKVRQIRAIRDSGVWVAQEALAIQFGISRGTLRSILKGEHWKHVK